jgi:hypothetical protein
MKNECLLIPALCTIFCAMSLANSKQAEPFTPKKTSLLDEDSRVEAEMSLVRAPDGSLYALQVILRNTSRDRDIVIRLNDYRPAAFLLTIRDENGKTISTPLKKFSHNEKQTFSSFKIEKLSSRQWCIPIAEHLQDKRAIQGVAKGSVHLGIAFQYAIDQTDARDFKQVLIQLHDTEVSFAAKAP